MMIDPITLSLSFPIILSLVIRLLVPLLIFRWPFFGYVGAMLADALGDCMLVDLMGGSFGSGANYHIFDKWLDFYMITIAVIAALRFVKIEKLTSIILYLIRAIGIIFFEITQLHIFLVIFPNVFEFFFVFITFTKKFWKKFRLTKKNLWVVMTVLTVPKLILELLFHYLNVDQFFWNLWVNNKHLFIIK